jgi:hypothetical protein
VTSALIAPDFRDRLRPWIRAELLLRMIRSTHWDSTAWPTLRQVLKRVIRVQSALRRGCWWN